ncbi:MAG TPA: hypothetical protein VFE59_27715 [Trebonia sp.]|nr:hypothetical protein [Trebonia sp.]
MGDPVGRPGDLEAGGHQIPRLAAASSPRWAGLGAQGDRPLAGEGLGEPVRVALGHQVGVADRLSTVAVESAAQLTTTSGLGAASAVGLVMPDAVRA